MKTLDYSNLRNKTIYDFCDDEEILKEINYYGSKEKYLEVIKECNKSKSIHFRSRNAFNLSELSELTKNKDLYDAVHKEYKQEFEEFFNE